MIAALELRPAAAAGWLLDADATPLHARARVLEPQLSPAQRWLQLMEVARELCFAAVIEPAQLQRIALVFPGALSAQGMVQEQGSGFGGYDLRRGLREHLASDAELVVASAAVAEAWAQTHAGVLRGFDNWLFVSLDDRLEAVACARGTWLQSDLGALILERDGPLDGSGRRGTLNAFCSGSAFAERARSYSLNVAPPQIWALAPTNFAAQSLAADYVSRLAQGLAGGIALLGSQRVCLGGELGRALFAQLQPDLASQLRDYLPPGTWNGEVVAAAPGQPNGIAPGALALASLGPVPL